MGSICSQLIFLIDPGEWFNLFRSNQSFDHKKTNNSINKSIIKFPTLLIFFKDRREQLDEGQSFLKIRKIKRSKIKSSKDRIPNPARMYSLWLCTCSVHVYPSKYLWQCPFIRSNLPNNHVRKKLFLSLPSWWTNIFPDYILASLSLNGLFGSYFYLTEEVNTYILSHTHTFHTHTHPHPLWHTIIDHHKCSFMTKVQVYEFRLIICMCKL